MTVSHMIQLWSKLHTSFKIRGYQNYKTNQNMRVKIVYTRVLKDLGKYLDKCKIKAYVIIFSKLENI
jgi:hypothetical protein